MYVSQVCFFLVFFFFFTETHYLHAGNFQYNAITMQSMLYYTSDRISRGVLQYINVGQEYKVFPW